MHENCIDFIQKSVEESTTVHIVVVTHHLPTLQTVAPHHRGSVLNSAFASECGKLIADSGIEGWIYWDSLSLRVMDRKRTWFIITNFSACADAPPR